MSVSLTKYVPQHAAGTFRPCCPQGNYRVEFEAQRKLSKALAIALVIPELMFHPRHAQGVTVPLAH